LEVTFAIVKKKSTNLRFQIPKIFDGVNYEVELGVVIGETCKNVSPDQAMDFVAGYCLSLDMTAMEPIVEARKSGHPWCLGKAFDTATPIGRFIGQNEMPNPSDVTLWCKINNELKQNCSTNDMVFSIPELISFISKYMSLETNDIILTGTPAGAGRVVAGDVIECGVGDLEKMKFLVEKDK
jgi:acylpyruvate hydrolase